MTKPNIILASGSKIRKDILRNAGINFDVIVKPVDESAIKEAMLADNAPLENIADALAESKSVRVSQQNSGLVIGADQIMVMDDKLYDKPSSLTEAKERLLLMRGNTHFLIGAVVISENGIPVWRYLSKTKLTMRFFSEKFIDEYIGQEGESLLKSVGAYKFEGRGSQLFSDVKGDFFSILGLPLLPVLDFLRTRGAISK